MIKQMVMIIFIFMPFINSMELRQNKKLTYAQVVRQSQMKPLTYLQALTKAYSQTINKCITKKSIARLPYIPRSESEESIWLNLSGLQKKRDLERQRNNSHKKKQCYIKKRTLPKLEPVN